MRNTDQLTLDGRNLMKEARDLQRRKIETMESKCCFGKAGALYYRLNAECRTCIVSGECGFSPLTVEHAPPLTAETVPSAANNLELVKPNVCIPYESLNVGLHVQRMERCFLIK